MFLKRALRGVLLASVCIAAAVATATPASAVTIKPAVITYQFVAVNSAKCLDVVGGSLSDGARVQQWTCNGNLQQQWTLSNTGMLNKFYVKNVKSGKCLDVKSASVADGAVIQQFTCNSSLQQIWRFDLAPSGLYVRLRPMHSDKCLDVTGGPGATGNGVLLQQWTCLASLPTNQQFIY
jgi:hypothetical protein